MKKSIIIISICLAVSQLNAQDLSTVVSKSEKALGVKSRKKLRSLQSGGHFIMRDTDAKIPFKVVQAKPDLIRIETTVFGFKAIQTYNGETAWRLTPTQGLEASKTDPREMEFISNVLALEGPFSLEKGDDFTLKYGGNTAYNGKDYEMLLLSSKTEKLKYFIHPKTWLIDAIRYEYQKNGGWYSMEYRVKSYQDFKGAKFPMEVIAVVNGVEMITLNVTKIKLPENLDMKSFGKPSYN